MKRILSVLFVLSTLCPQYVAAQVPDTCVASMPSLLLKSILKESEVDSLLLSNTWGQESKTNKYWTVYSDRSLNWVYDTPSLGGIICDTLDFNEQVRIAKISNDFALVYTENQKRLTFPLISKSAKIRGWIPMKNLLLWNSCLTNDVGVYKKALLTHRLDEQREDDRDINKCYLNPITKNRFQNLVADRSFYFVMKQEENGMVLLSKKCKMEGATSQVLYGWVSTKSFVPWNNRMCLEPNWKLFVTEPLKGKSAKVYRTNGENAASIKLCELNQQVKSQITRYRWDADRIRFPLLETDSNGKEQYHVMAYCTPQECGIPYLIIGESSVLFEFEGYVDKQMDGVNIWEPVLCITSDELALLMERWQPIMTASNVNDRKLYIEALKSLIYSIVPNMTPTEINTMDIQEIMALSAGIDTQKVIKKGVTLANLQDGNSVGQEQFEAMIADFRLKFMKIKKIRETRYPFSLERDKITWYWLPLEDLP